jgi:ATP-dependent RNA circularization protein (DNA/RNA ligase family)
MSANFYRFPHTPHLAWLGKGTPRNDKIFTPTQAKDFLRQPIVVEEKIDGTNLGISFSQNGGLQVQNRGSYLSPPFTGQFDRLPLWLTSHASTLYDVIGDQLVLFGEWCTSRHSLSYTELPDWFLGFDVFNSDSKKFYNTRRRNDLLARAGIKQVQQVAYGQFTLIELRTLLNSAKSFYRDGIPEGFYLRAEDDSWLIARAKLVRSEFTQAITTHWRNRNFERNQVTYR